MENKVRTILVTGGAGFIGSHLVLNLMHSEDCRVINLDLLTYAGDLKRLKALKNEPRHIFIQGDIRDAQLLSHLFEEYNIDSVINCAAESHVDRAFQNPELFYSVNVMGTQTLLDAARNYWAGTSSDAPRFLHVSSDEVYGDCTEDEPFTELSPLRPNHPYAASKAAADLLAHSYFKTYGLPVLISRGANTFGAAQHEEKLVPHVITSCLRGKPPQIHGSGEQLRGWLHVDDHCSALRLILNHGKPGESYNVAANTERSVLDICTIIRNEFPGAPPPIHIADRLFQDRRFPMSSEKIRLELGWETRHDLTDAMTRTVQWYRENRSD